MHNLYALRSSLNLNQDEMAKRIGISRAQYSRWETGKLRRPHKIRAKLIAAGLIDASAPAPTEPPPMLGFTLPQFPAPGVVMDWEAKGCIILDEIRDSYDSVIGAVVAILDMDGQRHLVRVSLQSLFENTRKIISQPS